MKRCFSRAVKTFMIFNSLPKFPLATFCRGFGFCTGNVIERLWRKVFAVGNGIFGARGLKLHHGSGLWINKIPEAFLIILLSCSITCNLVISPLSVEIIWFLPHWVYFVESRKVPEVGGTAFYLKAGTYLVRQVAAVIYLNSGFGLWTDTNWLKFGSLELSNRANILANTELMLPYLQTFTGCCGRNWKV